MTAKKPYLLCTTHGTGARPIFALLSEVFRQQFGVEPLFEYFDTWGNSVSDGYTEIMQEFLPERCDMPREIISGEIRRRLHIIKRFTGRYFFQVMVDQVTDEAEEWLAQNYEFIFLEPRDLFDFTLNNLIWRLTGRTYEKALRSLKPDSLTASRLHFDSTLECLEKLIRMKAQTPHRVTLYAEDFVQKPPGQFLADSGLGTFSPKLWAGKSNIKPIHRENKLALFTNRRFILEWCKGANIQVGESYLAGEGPSRPSTPRELNP